ncbi:pectinesterase family protein [Arenimonas sp. MALMAid1274]|uniref:pectinesterase family protein n=1 Tax=Arenimonas sp. MALMAid1274 TaxID=3411630 RepID=UPI003BA091DA
MISRRHFLAAGLAASALAACRPARAAPAFDARVRADGRGSHATLAAAIADAPGDGRVPYRILVGRGVWREKLVIDKPNLHLVGEDRHGSVIDFDAAAGMARPDGQAWGTWGCASVIVRAPDFRADSLCIRNSFDYVGNLAAPRFEPIGPNGAQAVALMLDQGADRSHLRDVTLTGHQDTLFTEAGRALFERCVVTGSVDFIFGAGRTRFEHCELQSRFRPGKPRQGYVAVPSTPASQPQGLVFDQCRLTREAAVPDASVALGRAWRPGRSFADGKYGDPAALGSAVFLSCWMDAHIDGALGWEPMAYTARDGQRVMLEPRDARLYEFDSRGPGAVRSPSRRWLRAEQAATYSRAAMFAGWSP